MDVHEERRYRRWGSGSTELLNMAEGNGDMMDRPQLRRPATRGRSIHWILVTLYTIVFLTRSTNAAFIEFENCLETNILNDPSQLQFVPRYFHVVYDTAPGPNPLDIVIYGNVTGNGEIVNIVDNDGNETYTTLFTTLDVLSFTPYDHASQFCQNVTQGSCPLGPVYSVNGYVFAYAFPTTCL